MLTVEFNSNISSGMQAQQLLPVSSHLLSLEVTICYQQIRVFRTKNIWGLPLVSVIVLLLLIDIASPSILQMDDTNIFLMV